MRSFAHICAIVLLLPQVLLASLLALAGYVATERTVWSILTNAWAVMGYVFGWLGLAVVIGGLGLIIAGFTRRFRVVASWIVIAIAAYSGVALCRRMGLSLALESWWFFVPALAAIGISGWSLSRERSEVDLRQVATAKPTPSHQ